jgi:hypothetical protein
MPCVALHFPPHQGDRVARGQRQIVGLGLATISRRQCGIAEQTKRPASTDRIYLAPDTGLELGTCVRQAITPAGEFKSENTTTGQAILAISTD